MLRQPGRCLVRTALLPNLIKSNASLTYPPASRPSFFDLRHLHSLHYSIQLCRLERLVVRLPPSPLQVACRAPHFLQTDHQQSPDGYTNHDNDVGVPLSEEAEAAYVAILADELALERAWKASIRKLSLDYTAYWWQCYYAGHF